MSSLHSTAMRRRTVPPDSSQQKLTSFSSNVLIDTYVIATQDNIHSVRFLDGKHVVTGGWQENIRRWQVANGKEARRPMDAGNPVFNVAVSQDGKWIVCGTQSGQVMAWNAMNDEKVIEMKAHQDEVHAVDISTDGLGKKLATASDDRTAGVWSFPAGERLLDPLKHNASVVAVKFSPGGKYLATASSSIRVYESHDGQLLADFPIRVSSRQNECLAWGRAAKRLFVLSRDGDIHCLDVSNKVTLTKWRIHSNKEPKCIALACNDTIIVASADSSLSLWDTITHQQIGTVSYTHNISSMAISPNYDIATSGNKAITLRDLSDVLPEPYREDLRLERELRRWQIENPQLYKMVMDVRARDAHKKDSMTNKFEKTVRELHDQVTTFNKEKDTLNTDIQSLRAQNEKSTREVNQLTETTKSLLADLDAKERNLDHLRMTVQDLHKELTVSQNALREYNNKYEREATCAHGHIYDIAHSALEIADVMKKDLKPDELIVHQLETLLTGVAKVSLCRHSVNDVLGGADKPPKLNFHVYRAVCDALESGNRVPEAIKCFRKMQIELLEETSPPDGRSRWESDFRQRCIGKLEKEGDKAMELNNYDAAIISYSNALSLSPASINDIIVKCCKVRVGLLEDGFMSRLTNQLSRRYNQASEHHPSSYIRYKRKHVLSHRTGRYKEAFKAFEIMLSRMDNSPDPQVQDMRSQYVDVTPQIRTIIEETIRDIPCALIDTGTGRLYDKAMQASAFEELPIFNQLRSSMTTPDQLDHPRIREEVEKFYEYVMFSHRWQPYEPTFQMVEKDPVYALPASPTNDKLVNFCKLVKSRHFRWAWSDTCCINQSDKGVQQESVVAMFRWYCRAALTIVHLLGVHSKSQRKGSMKGSIWNMRGWTYQEYVASKVLQFYTEDWQPYLGLEIFNHKESSVILEEMEQATNFTTEALATLQPGLTGVREKLYLASKRRTTREEDIAYCLFGIFNAVLPVIYGEGKQAVGRLLEHILTRSDNVTILAWTGISGNNHSYLPSDLTVYNQVVPPHIPPLVETSEMDRMVVDMQSCFPDLSAIVKLYEQLHNLSPLSLVAGRLRLSGLVFPLDDLERLPVECNSDSMHPVYRATSPALGDLWIETKDELVGTKNLVLIHPWISPLIDEDFSDSTTPFNLHERSVRLLIRLRQPFGALLLASEGRVQFKRVATDSLIKVQIRSETSLGELMQSIRTVDVQ